MDLQTISPKGELYKQRQRDLHLYFMINAINYFFSLIIFIIKAGIIEDPFYSHKKKGHYGPEVYLRRYALIK
jgi:hypothetical protein